MTQTKMFYGATFEITNLFRAFCFCPKLCPLLFLLHSALCCLTSLFSLQCAQVADWQAAKSIYDFNAKDIDGNEVSLEKYR